MDQNTFKGEILPNIDITAEQDFANLLLQFTDKSTNTVQYMQMSRYLYKVLALWDQKFQTTVTDCKRLQNEISATLKLKIMTFRRWSRLIDR
jgi:hypothetical protein